MSESTMVGMLARRDIVRGVDGKWRQLVAVLAAAGDGPDMVELYYTDGAYDLLSAYDRVDRLT